MPHARLNRTNRTRRAGRAWAGVPVALAALAIAACGGDDKPGYCSDRTDLQNSVKDIANLSPSGGVSGVKAQVDTIKSEATSLVDSAKSDFPSETDAIKASVDQLESAVNGLPSNPSPAQLGTVATNAASVVSSVNAFVDATKSEC